MLPYDALKLPRYQYLSRRVALDWRSSLPDGYALRRIDRELLHGRPELERILARMAQAAKCEVE